MQYKALALAALTSGALAAPWNYGTDDSIKVTLSKDGMHPSDTLFSESKLGELNTQAPNGGNGPFNTFELNLGNDVVNKDLRCQILDDHNMPIIAIRNTNVDVTFSDADKGPWTFRDGDAYVSSIICDPSLKQNDDSDLQIRITLSNQVEVDEARQIAVADASLGPKEADGFSAPAFRTFTVSVGEQVQKKDIRCQALDQNGRPITGKRNGNIDTTFADGDAGEWTFIQDAQNPAIEIASLVSKVVCDPSFVKASA